MSVVVVGLQHRRTPLELLERVTVGDADLPKVLGDLRDRVNLQESVLLSTCLRTEVYAVVDRFHEAVTEVEEVLAAKAELEPSELEPYFTVAFDDDVPAWLFAVASGLESAVPGETEVLGQVRRAWERARDERVSGPVLSGLFRHAVQTGKRVRSETAIARGTTSFSHAAVELAEQRRRGGLSGARVLVLGAGEMGRGIVTALSTRSSAARPTEVVVVNRTEQRAGDLRETAGGAVAFRAAPFESLAAEVARADVLLAAVESETPVLGPDLLAGPGSGRDGPLLVVDLGVPRNVDPAAGGLPGVELLDMDDLRASVDRAVGERHGEAVQARAIVDEEVTRYRASVRARGAAPVVAALRGRLEDLRAAEVERRRTRSGDRSGVDWSEVDAVTRSVVAKLLHEPTVLLKESAGTARGERLVEALRVLFDL